MAEMNMCANCGYNLEADQPLELGQWHIDPRSGVSYAGRFVTRRMTWTTLLHTLAKEGGRSVKPEVLLSRISDSENLNALRSQIAQLRRHLRESGVPDPLCKRPGNNGMGYRWEEEAVGGQV